VDENILEVKNITKEFPGVKALDNVSIQVRKGEILALVGENGAGKTTLMKVLSGAYPHTSYSGEIYFDNAKRLFSTPKQSEEAGIEMVYQEVSMMPELTVAENIFIGNYPTKGKILIDKKTMNEKTKSLLEQLHVNAHPDDRMRTLNSSVQQLIAIVKSLNKKPKLLVLDEPTSSITKTETEHLFERIAKLKADGIACIYISHKLEEVYQIADRIIVMRDGCIVGDVTRGNFDSKEIVSMMVGRQISDRYPETKGEIKDELLSVKSLSVVNVRDRKKKLIDDISFDLKKGEILGFAGLVGSGRSEIVNAIFGYGHKEDHVELYIEGERVEINNPKDAIKYGLALVTEDRRKTGLVNSLRIRENATLIMLKKLFENGFINKKKERQIGNEYKDKLSIKAPSIETWVYNLSGGNQQKVVLAKWLMAKPKILILDEPTRGIDVGAKYEIYMIMNEMKKSGVGIIMISSELPEVLGMCDRVLVIGNGKIRGEFHKGEVSEDQIMMAAFDVGEGA